MKALYFIRELELDSYYWRYRLDDGFTKDIREATSFESEEIALKEFQEDNLGVSVSGRMIEIVKAYSLNS